jgi:hypothetical protein
MGFWITNGDQTVRGLWGGSSTVLAEESIALCRADLAAKLEEIVETSRRLESDEREHIRNAAELSGKALGTFDFNDLRARFELPLLNEIARPQELPRPSYADRHRRHDRDDFDGWLERNRYRF